MDTLRISLIQTPLYWENPLLNRQMLAWKIRDLGGETDLILLPEMFTSGFTMDAQRVAEPFPGPTLEWMQGLSHETGAAITGSLVVEEGGRFFNRLLWVAPDGRHQHYDKRHLFGLAGEDGVYTAGVDRLVVDWQDWRICPLICYDLRFPVWSRNTAAVDVLIYVANWPEPRRQHWLKLLAARAIENQCYVAAVNRVGRDEHGHPYAGDSMLIDFNGETILHAAHTETVLTATITRSALQAWRRKLPFLQDREVFGMDGIDHAH
jgi:omega-amidase